MAPRHKETSPAEAESGSEMGLSFDISSKASLPQAMTNIDTWKSKRSEIQKSIDKDYASKLTALKSKIKAHYQDETQKISDHNKKQVERLVAALETRISCEDKITEHIDSLRDDAAHLAMLMDAVYVGRKEAATRSAKAAKA